MLAHEAGAALADLELLQFHPTAVTGIPGREGFLVTEAIRGEGATLHRRARASGSWTSSRPGTRSRARSKTAPERSGGRSVGLDMRAIDPAHFPNVVAALRESGLDPARELVPVAPAAHYMMGGIVTDLHARSTVPGPVCRGRVLVHGPARREPARLQLPQRVLRVRAQGDADALGARRRARAARARRLAALRRKPGP